MTSRSKHPSSVWTKLKSSPLLSIWMKYGMQGISRQGERRLRRSEHTNGFSWIFPSHMVNLLLSLPVSPTIQAITIRSEEEIALAAGAWIWDYIRRSHQVGVFLPLSGGSDSGATAVIVYNTARMLCVAVKERNLRVIKDLRTVCGEPQDSTWEPSTPQEICHRIFLTCFMGMENSSKEARQRAKALATDITAYHIDLNMDTIVAAFTTLFTTLFSRILCYRTQGGSNQEGLALQKTQSRSCMALSYLLASTLTLIRGCPNGGNFLVLDSANVDECLRDCLTKTRLLLRRHQPHRRHQQSRPRTLPPLRHARIQPPCSSFLRDSNAHHRTRTHNFHLYTIR